MTANERTENKNNLSNSLDESSATRPRFTLSSVVIDALYCQLLDVDVFEINCFANS